MEIKQVLNNNVALVLNHSGEEVIVWGKGLGFQKSAGDLIDKDIVEKVFPTSDASTFFKLQDVMSDIPEKYFETASQVLDQEGDVLKLNGSLFLALSDHIYSAVKRFEEGLDIRNPLLFEIKKIYPDEFSLGLRALELIKENFGVTFSEDEAAFIAMHIINAEVGLDDKHQTNSKAYQSTVLVQELLKFIRLFFKVPIDETSDYYSRFLTHLTFFSQRIIQNMPHKNEVDNELFGIVKKKYPNAFECVQTLATFIKEDYGYDISEDECLYLTVHIQRMIYGRS